MTNTRKPSFKNPKKSEQFCIEWSRFKHIFCHYQRSIKRVKYVYTNSFKTKKLRLTMKADCFAQKRVLVLLSKDKVMLKKYFIELYKPLSNKM